MSRTLAAVIGGAAGALALVGIVVLFIWFCVLHNRNISRTSETGSSDLSLQAGRNVGIELSLRGGVPLPPDSQEARQFMLEELSLATKNFSDINFIGVGKFGEVYKGLLHDGMIVAIKKRLARPSQEFIEEVYYLSSIRHRHVVSLLGYCQENEQQILIYEYILNGSVSSHIYGAGQVTSERLEFKHRLSIALGAARGNHLQTIVSLLKGSLGTTVKLSSCDLEVTESRRGNNLLQKCKENPTQCSLLIQIPCLLLHFAGLAYLHALNPPLVHKDFTTENVLVDENFIAKVADAGLRNLLARIDTAGSSSQIVADDVFLDPEVKQCGRFSEKSDVYSFGVFLLELVSGKEAAVLPFAESGQSVPDWVLNHRDASDIAAIIDHKVGGSFTTEGMNDFIDLTIQCLNPSSERRPIMNNVVLELDRILEKEMSLIMGETPTVTLGSHLFTALK